MQNQSTQLQGALAPQQLTLVALETAISSHLATPFGVPSAKKGSGSGPPAVQEQYPFGYAWQGWGGWGVGVSPPELHAEKHEHTSNTTRPTQIPILMRTG